MSEKATALLDRCVKIISGPGHELGNTRRMSDLRDLPYVVVLGEPGSGKSTVLETEAMFWGTTVWKVRDLLNGDYPPSAQRAFFDALDEYRVDGAPADKIHQLSAAISRTQARSWVLTCRADDWRPNADMRALDRVVSEGQDICVVTLLPLSDSEKLQVLAAIGATNPGEFVERAMSMGAGGLLESPLSLRLLFTAIGLGEDWPKSRFALFEQAIARMAREENEEHLHRVVSPEQVIDDAGTSCLLLLASGANSIWTIPAPPTVAGQRLQALDADSIGIQPERIKNMVRTALFRGEGHSFQPVHQTLAEFLASRALAKRVANIPGEPAMPLSRALALITGRDGAPPTELRGLFAWFAAHLGLAGHEDSVAQMIEIDSLAVHRYGDAGVLPLVNRRALLTHVKNPDYLSLLAESSAIGGLATHDMAPDLRAILAAVPGDVDHQHAILDILESAAHLKLLEAELHDLALDVSRTEGIRARAAEVWTKYQAGAIEKLHELLDHVTAQPSSTTRENLRIQILVSFPDEGLDYNDVRAVLADYERCKDDTNGSTTTDLYDLQRRLAKDISGALFDVPYSIWRSDPQGGHHRENAVDDLMENALANAIHRLDGEISATQLVSWCNNISKYGYLEISHLLKPTLRAWLGRSPSREMALMRELIAGCGSKGPSAIFDAFTEFTGSAPSKSSIHYLVDAGLATAIGADTAPLELQVAVEAVKKRNKDDDDYQLVHDAIKDIPQYAGLFDELTVPEVPDWQVKQEAKKNALQQKRAAEREQRIASFMPVVGQLRQGKELRRLDEAANRYFMPQSASSLHPQGMDEVRERFGTDVARAMEAGWIHLVHHWPSHITCGKLGEMEATHKRYFVELPGIAGLDRLLWAGKPLQVSSVPLPLAISIMRQRVGDSGAGRQAQLDNVANQRLELDPEEGSEALLQYWTAAIQHSINDLPIFAKLHHLGYDGMAVQIAMRKLLTTHFDISADTLLDLLQAATRQLSLDELRVLTTAALASLRTVGEQRTLWRTLELSLDPIETSGSFIAEYAGQDFYRHFGNIGNHALFSYLSLGYNEDERATMSYVKAQVLGRTTLPEWTPISGRLTISRQGSYAVQRAIETIAAHRGAFGEQLLAKLASTAELYPWHDFIAKLSRQQRRVVRDAVFRHPVPRDIRAALGGGPPLNSADLRAVLLEELGLLRRELRTADTTPWRSYWNLGDEPTPRVENLCRDHLLQRLQDRLKRAYGINAVLPEVQAADDTRADFVAISQAGTKLPVEVKRHYNASLWTAAASQLQRYASDPMAFGYGIFLVFWFGTDVESTPPRPDGGTRPESAAELEKMLIADLTSEIRSKTDVLVFDVAGLGGARSAVTKAAKARTKATVSLTKKAN